MNRTFDVKQKMGQPLKTRVIKGQVKSSQDNNKENGEERVDILQKSMRMACQAHMIYNIHDCDFHSR